MDRLPGHEAATRQARLTEIEGCKILRFPSPRPRLPVIDQGSAWYHQSAIEAEVRPEGPKR